MEFICSCSVCFKPSENTPTYCTHVTCKNCLDEWAQTSNTCPICRKNLTTGFDQKFENAQTMQNRFSWPAWDDRFVRNTIFPVSTQWNSNTPHETQYNVHEIEFTPAFNRRMDELIISENTTQRYSDPRRVQNIPINSMLHENEINYLMRELLPISASHSERELDNNTRNETIHRRRFVFR